MDEYQLLVTPAARDDLINIYQFGLRAWGKRKSSQYLDHLKAQFGALTENSSMGIERPELLATIRSFPVESHVIFYQVQPKRIEILRVLHVKQDSQRKIK